MREHFVISGAKGTACVNKVVNTLKRHIKVNYVEADYDNLTVTIDFDGISLEKLNDSITAMGYKLIESRHIKTSNKLMVYGSLTFVVVVLVMIMVFYNYI